MNWTKAVYVLLITLVYIPMVFLGANVFFPEFTGSDSYFQEDRDCYGKYPYPIAEARIEPDPESNELIQLRETCFEDLKEERQKFNEEKRTYDGQKYVFMSIFNLLVLLVVLFVPGLQPSVSLGLFSGSILTTFFSTMAYFETNSKIGFLVLVVIFFTMLYVINKKQDKFFDLKRVLKKSKKKK